jgi:hypothetical protein
MAKVKVTVDRDAVREFVQKNKPVRDLLHSVASAVQANAESSASDAEKGPGGTIHSYASAGFSVAFDMGKKIPRFIVKSNADPEQASRAYWYTQKTFGVAHLRQALYKETQRGG